MEYLVIIGAILCGWAMLRTLGGEREYELRRMKMEAEREAARLAAEKAHAEE